MPVIPCAGRNPKIYIFHPGALGDGLLALPSLRRVKRYYHSHDLVWIGSQPLGKIFVQSEEVHESHSFDAWNFDNFVEELMIDLPVRGSHSNNQSRIIGWMRDTDGWWQTRLSPLEKSRALFKSPFDPALSARHMEDRYLETLDEWLGPQAPKPSETEVGPLGGTFHCSRPDVGDLNSDRPLILIHPGSGGSGKCVPWSILSEVAKGFLGRSFLGRICLIGGPADSKFLEPLVISLKSANVGCFQDMELPEVCGLLKKTSVFIGHDSGLSHLAAKLGVSSVLLFGPTDPAIWAPRGTHVKVLRSPALSFAPDDIVLEAEQFLSRQQPELIA